MGIPAGMIIQSKKPDPSLSHLVREYYYFTTGPQNRSKYVPVIDDGCYDFIFFLERDSSLVYGPRQISLPITSRVFTIHQLQPPYRIRFGDSLTFFTIKVQPWANAHFFSKLSEPGVVDIKSRYADMELFHQQVLGDLTLENRFKKADAFMMRHQSPLSDSAQWVQKVCEEIYRQAGMTSVSSLSERFGKSRQYLGKLFKQEVMYSLKKFIITVRIMDLVKYRIKHPDISMTELCYRYDYFDQSHFNRDFKRICGVTPTSFFAKLPEFLLRH
ncbi:MAG: helix-turn-helix transcriptional regulator [Robiginitalea sp.]|jgi:AraC-like DNA-binding protein